MSLTFNTKTYDFDSNLGSPDAARYTGPNHSFAGRDLLDLRRSWPKATADYPGNAKTQSKLVRQMTDGTNPVGEAIVKVDFQYPATAATAEVDALVDDLASLVALAIYKAMQKDADISH